MSTTDTTKPLAGKIALVAGATRGAGRGIATMLGATGATVICTGRSTRGNPATAGRPETIEETADLVTAAGGIGVAIRVDHTIAEEVRAVFERVERDFNRLDILVNDIWGGDELTEWGRPFWKLDPAKGLRMQELAVDTHVLTARFGAPLMVRQKSGLIIEITDGMHLDYRGNLFYDLAKISAIRLAYAMASELRRHNVVALSLTPGFLRSEAMLDGFDVTEANWRDAIAKNPDFAESETPAYVGRAVVALATDPNVAAKAGKVCSSWTLAREYGLHDTDGNQPDWGAYFERMVNAILDRGGPSNRDEELRVWSRYEQIRSDPQNADEAARIAAALKRAGVSILP
jgi:NAD(P)-dependent dehydrogenase (short-subunit alcohol dehydrogenase family)